MTLRPQHANVDSSGRHPGAPAWDGNVRDLTDDELLSRDRGLMLHISALLVRYDSTRDDAPFSPVNDLTEARPWLQRLADARNENKRREASGSGLNPVA